MSKPSLDAFKLAEKAALEEIKSEENNQTLKQIWLKLADQLAIDGVPKEKISTVGKEIILEKKKEQLAKLGIDDDDIHISSWWNQVMSAEGYTDTKYSPVEVMETEPQNSSINTPNQPIIQRLRLTREIVNLAINKFENSEDINSIFDEKHTSEWLLQWDAILAIAEDGVNEKTKIPQNTEHLLLDCLASASSLTQGAKIFMKMRVQLMEKLGKFLTVKQATKFKNGDKANQLSLFAPDSRDTAIFLKYYGLQCPKCKSWKVREHPDSYDLRCIDCDNNFAGKTVSKCWYCQGPLYKEHLQKMIKNKNKCPHCDKDVTLPEELIEYASS